MCGGWTSSARTAATRMRRSRGQPRSLLIEGVGLLLATYLMIGCGERLPTYDVKGRVLVGSSPAAGATVILHPQGEATELQRQRPIGQTDAQGFFTLTTYDGGDGVPAGEYRVSIIWPHNRLPIPQADKAAADERRRRSAGDRLKGRYLDPSQSGLIAVIKKGQAELAPFQLEGPPSK